MKQILVGSLILFQLFLSCAERSDSVAKNELNLSLTWDVVDNGSKPGTKSLSVLSISNNSDQSLTDHGWTIYFNSGNFEVVDTTIAKITLINGDLQALTPGSKFGALEKGEGRKIEIKGGGITNITRIPVGVYLVFNDEPGKGYPLELALQTSFGPEENDFLVASRIYRQNAEIKDLPVEKLVKIFPTPSSYSENGERFILDSSINISAEAGFENEANHLSDYVAELTGSKPTMQAKQDGKTIVLKKAQGLGPEEYQLSVRKDKIIITATTPGGVFYGIQSLKTLVPPTPNSARKSIEIPGVEVKDAPRFPHRAFMLDVARNFHSKEQVKKVLDLMALYKLNVFHLHFSEDEAWRLEIPSLPELTEVGAKRAPTADGKDHLPPSFGSGAEASNTGTGFYSRADFIEILKFAHARHIKVIPEVETPGHARAAIQAMKARYERLLKEGKEEEARKYLLHDPEDESQYRSVQGWDDNVINVAMPSAYTFMETVADEIIDMYKEAGAPLETIHFGGDEVPEGVWEKSPAVNALLSGDGASAGVVEKNSPSVDTPLSQEDAPKTPNDLWFYYYKKVNNLLKERGLALYGWEEVGLLKTFENGKGTWVPNKELAKDNVQVDVWNNLVGSGKEDIAYRMANSGIKVVLTAVTNFYFDLAYNPSFHEPGLNWGGYVDIDKPFYFIPYDYLRNLRDDEGKLIDQSKIVGKESLTEYGKSNIVGLQGALWSENVRSPEILEYLLLPKFLGLAERAWAKEPEWAKVKDPAKSKTLYQNAWSEFINLVGKRELPRLDHFAGGFHYRIPTPGAIVNQGQVEANIQFPEFSIRYTTDGTEPDQNSPAYTGPIKEKGTIKLKGFNPAGRSSHTLIVENK